MEPTGRWKSLVSQKLKERDAREQTPFISVFEAYKKLLNAPQIVLDGVPLPDHIDSSKHGTSEELLFVYRKMSETQRVLREVEKENGILKNRLDAMQRAKPDSKEYAEELMHAYRKMGIAQDAEYALIRQLKASETGNASLRDQLEVLKRHVEELKALVHSKEESLATSNSQLGILRRELDSIHRTLLRREEDAKVLTTKSNILAQENDTLTRLRTRMESDYASLKSVVIARDTTISELKKSNIEIQKKLDALRHSMTSHAAPSTQTNQTQNSNNTGIASSLRSFIGLSSTKGSQPLPMASYTRASPSCEPSSADEYSSDAMLTSDHGEIFKLTDNDVAIDAPDTPPSELDRTEVGSVGMREVGKASLKLGELNRRIEAETSKSTFVSPPKPSSVKVPVFSFVTTIQNSKPTPPPLVRTESTPGPVKSESSPFSAPPGSNKHLSMSALPVLSPPCPSEPATGSQKLSKSASSAGSDASHPLVFDAAAEARLIEIQRKLDDTSSSWSSFLKSTKSAADLPSQIKTTIQVQAKTKQALLSACVDAAGVKLLIGGELPLTLYDLSSGAVQKTYKGPTKTITSVDYCDEKQLVLASATDNTARIWFPNASVPCTINHPAEVHMAAFCGPGRVATIAKRALSIWDIHSVSSYKFTFSSPQKSLAYALCVNNNSNLIYTGHLDRQIRIFDSKRGLAATQFDTVHSDNITGLQLSPDGTKLFSTARDNTICCYDTSNYKLLAQYSHKDLRLESNWAHATLSPTGEHIAIGSLTGQIFIWDTTTNKLMTTLKASKNPIRGIVWNPVNYNSMVSFDDHGLIASWI